MISDSEKHIIQPKFGMKMAFACRISTFYPEAKMSPYNLAIPSRVFDEGAPMNSKASDRRLKVIPIITALIFGCGALLSACGGSSEPADPAPASEEPTTTEVPATEATPEAEAVETEESAPEVEETEAQPPAEETTEEPTPEPEASASSSDFTGVRGTVTLDGEKPRRKAIQMSADPGCDALHSSPVGTENALVTGSGQIMNVFVYVKDGEKLGNFSAPTTPAKLDQVGCMYTPHMLGVQTNQPIDIVNSDPLAHNIHGLAKVNREFNFGQPTPGTRQHTLRRAENAITVKCDIHPWMNSILFVMDHPFFAITDNEGKYSLPNLPAGNHTLVAWHETFGEREMNISVSSGAGATADFTYTP